jgi:hypothetical protein
MDTWLKYCGTAGKPDLHKNRIECLKVKEEEVDEHYFLHSGA